MTKPYDSVKYFNEMYALDEGKTLREFPDMIRKISNVGTTIACLAVAAFWVYALLNQRPL